MTPQIRELLQKMTDFRQEVTHMDRVLVANEISRLEGQLAEAQGFLDMQTLDIFKVPVGSRFN